MLDHGGIGSLFIYLDEIRDAMLGFVSAISQIFEAKSLLKPTQNASSVRLILLLFVYA
jgi:hypothetical protein